MLRESNTFSGYSVHSLDEAETFYRDVLGLEVERDWMGVRLKLADNREVFLYQKDDHQPATYTVLNFMVDDIGATVDSLVAAGVTMERYDMDGGQDDKGIMRGKAADMGPDIAWFKDSSGNILGVLEN